MITNADHAMASVPVSPPPPLCVVGISVDQLLWFSAVWRDSHAQEAAYWSTSGTLGSRLLSAMNCRNIKYSFEYLVKNVFCPLKFRALNAR